MHDAPTAARRLDVPLVDGCRKLEDAQVGHLDGGEALVEQLLAAATDRSDMSDELARHDETWEPRYHFARERAHVLRPLNLPTGGCVLEVGAGCGAVTRYLGETCAVVDALEPTAERARIARLRTRDLASVEVFIGSLEALPREPAYDAVVVVGVLEYVQGPDPFAARVAFLREIAARLRPGGFVALAIENRFGVQYLAGHQEEHLAASFVGLENYLTGGIARTFSRTDLERIFREAGFRPSVKHVFPDYKFARMVFDDALLEGEARPLAWRVPRFPSGASPHVRPRLADEGRLWRGLVEDGLGGRFANSYLVLGTLDDAAQPWPEGLDAAFYSDHRRSRFHTEATVRGGEIRRRALRPAPDGDGLRHRAGGRRFLTGPALLELLDDADAPERARLLGLWRRELEALEPAADGSFDIDFVPHNLIWHEGRLVTVDEEWFHPGYRAPDVVARGLLQLAVTLADRLPPERWPDCETTRDLVERLAAEAGAEGIDFDAVAARECDLLAEMTGEPLERHRANMAAALERPLALGALGVREPELRERAERGREEAERHVEHVRAEMQRQLEEARAEGTLRERAQEERARHFEAKLDEATASSREGWDAYQRVVNSRWWKLTGPLRRISGR